MDKIESAQTARAKVRRDLAEIYRRLERLIEGASELDIEPAIARLTQIRSEVYEDLNQIIHEHMALSAVEFLSTRDNEKEVTWYWNPRQTGDHTEPDVRGMGGAQIRYSAEVTASASPQGVIDRRMQGTLAKLAQMKGELFYFVRTEKMRLRAETKVDRHGYDIEVVLLPLHPSPRGETSTS